MNLRIVDLGRICLENAGISTTAMSPSKIIERAVGMHTTGDFAQLLLGAGDRVLLQSYQTYQGGLKRVARKITLNDFRPRFLLQLGELPSLEKVAEHGEFKNVSIKEGKEAVQLATYGNIFAITRQALVNDDLGAFADMAARFGRAAAESEAEILAALLTSNPVLGDGIALFHADHGNLGSAAAISVTSLGAAKLAMRRQKGLSGKPIDVVPRYLVVPASLETVAEQQLATIAATQPGDANPFSGKLELVVDPRLDEVSTSQWFLVADQNAIDTLLYAYLAGAEGPQFMTRDGWETDGTEFKARLDFGAAVADFRGLYRNG